MVVADNALKSSTRKRYVDLNLWIRLNETQTAGIESTNLKIDKLLDNYRALGYQTEKFYFTVCLRQSTAPHLAHP